MFQGCFVGAGLTDVVIYFMVLIITITATNDTHPLHTHRPQHFYHNKTLLEYNNLLLEEMAYKLLVDRIAELSAGKILEQKSPFDDIIPSIELSTQVVAKDKYITGYTAIKNIGKKFIVYGAGIANDPSFEESMRNLGTSVYAFDCTINGNRNWRFRFIRWCIGTPKYDLKQSIYSRGVVNQNLTFKRISEVKKRLGHHRLDMFKLDIEGCEWDLLYEEIVNGADEDLPTQLLFELHTEGANWRFVPEAIVEGKRRLQVNQLILDLYNRNYRVFHILLNDGDSFCAEISLYRI